MMITIGITICDNDYTNLDNLLSNINNNVKAPHETIIVDNREKYKSTKLSVTPNYSFGKNAKSFAARLKIIELAKGDYIWFVDGDDEILGLPDINYKTDIVTFGYYTNTYEHTENYFNRESTNLRFSGFLSLTGWSLWNKLIKKSVLNGIESIGSQEIVALDDVLILAHAFSNSKKIENFTNIIYHQNPSTSNKDLISSVADLTDTLLSGHSIAVSFISKIITDSTEFDYVIRNNYSYLVNKIFNTARFYSSGIKDLTISLLNKLVEYVHTNESSYEDILYRIIGDKIYLLPDSIYAEYKAGFYRDCYNPIIHLTYNNVQTNKQETSNLIVGENVEDKLGIGSLEWGKRLSIVCVVYSGNTSFLNGFLDKVIANVKIPNEIILVDNGANVNVSKYQSFVKVKKMSSNVGTLAARKAGAELATGDYIWHVDIDDDIPTVYDANYGEADVIQFSYVNNHGQITEANITYRLTPTVWDKWVKRQVMLDAYKDFNTFWCCHCEDALLNLFVAEHYQTRTAVKYALLYKYTLADTSVTNQSYTTQAEVDKLVQEITGIFNTLKNSKIDEKTWKDVLVYDIISYYLGLFKNIEESLKSGFMTKLVNLVGSDLVFKAMSSNPGSSTINIDLTKYMTVSACPETNSLQATISENDLIFSKCDLSSDYVLSRIRAPLFNEIKDKKSYLLALAKQKVCPVEIGRIHCKHEACMYNCTKLEELVVKGINYNVSFRMGKEDAATDNGTIENFRYFLENIKGLGLDKLTISLFGDALFNDDVIDFLKTLTTSDAKVVELVTFGARLTDDKIKELKKVKPTLKFDITISAISDNLYRIVRGDTEFENAVNAVTKLKSLGWLNRINYIIQWNNVRELMDVPDFWKKKGISSDKICFSLVRDNDATIPNGLDNFYQVEDFVKAYKGKVQFNNLKVLLIS